MKLTIAALILLGCSSDTTINNIGVLPLTDAGAQEKDGQVADVQPALDSSTDAQADASVDVKQRDAEAVVDARPNHTCFDRSKNGDETDIDCGGSCGKKCESEQACTQRSDCECQPLGCVGNACGTWQKTGFVNGDETDVDCGGACGVKCAGNKLCKLNRDCQSNDCNGMRCQ